MDVIAGRLEADAERLDVPEQQDSVQRAPAPVKMTPSHAVVFLFVCATSSTKSLPHFAKLGVSGPLETPSFKKIPEPCAKNQLGMCFLSFWFTWFPWELGPQTGTIVCAI